MKSVLISIRPRWCELIASGKKTIEVRKTAPKEVPFKAYIYETYDKKYDDIGICWGNGKCFEHGCKKVIGEFVCDYLYENISYDCEASCVSVSKLKEYANGKSLYGWHISDLKIYDKPRDLKKFCVWKKCNSCKISGYESTACRYGEDCKVPVVITRPPQSWCYVEELP